jgi:hypothetical protein
MDYLAKALINKRNKQISIAISKKKFKILKNKIPKLIRIKGMEFEF